MTRRRGDIPAVVAHPRDRCRAGGISLEYILDFIGDVRLFINFNRCRVNGFVNVLEFLGLILPLFVSFSVFHLVLVETPKTTEEEITFKA